jgi:hypothetical protein
MMFGVEPVHDHWKTVGIPMAVLNFVESAYHLPF